MPCEPRQSRGGGGYEAHRLLIWNPIHSTILASLPSLLCNRSQNYTQGPNLKTRHETSMEEDSGLSEVEWKTWYPVGFHTWYLMFQEQTRLYLLHQTSPSTIPHFILSHKNTKNLIIIYCKTLPLECCPNISVLSPSVWTILACS